MMSDAGIQVRAAAAVGNVVEVLVLDHLRADPAAELLHLFPNISQEGVGGPPSDDHDGVDGDVVEEHRHRGARANGVGADVVQLETQAFLSYRPCCCLESVR